MSPGAGAGKGTGCAHGLILLRGGAVRDGDRPTPFRGESSGVIFREILDASPTPAVRLNPDLPVELERIVNHALEKDRNLRYQHASDMRAEMERLKPRLRDGARARRQFWVGTREGESGINAAKRNLWKIALPRWS